MGRKVQRCEGIDVQMEHLDTDVEHERNEADAKSKSRDAWSVRRQGCRNGHDRLGKSAREDEEGAGRRGV